LAARPDGRLGVGHPDVHVQRALGRPAQEPAHLLADPRVAREGRVPGVAERGRRMQSGGHRGRADARHRGAAAVQRLDRLGRGAARRRPQLELGGEQLVPGEPLRKVELRQHLRGDRRERAVAVEQEQLVLDPDPERLPLAERVLHHPASAASAAIRPITSAPASPLA
jgi:hypothetical protein